MFVYVIDVGVYVCPRYHAQPRCNPRTAHRDLPHITGLWGRPGGAGAHDIKGIHAPHKDSLSQPVSLSITRVMMLVCVCVCVRDCV